MPACPPCHYLPPDLSLEEAAAGLFDRSVSDGKLNSLSVVLGQEVERFTRLAGVMRTSMAQVQAAIKGLVVMSETLEATYNSLLLNEVRRDGQACLQVPGNRSSCLLLCCWRRATLSKCGADLIT